MPGEATSERVLWGVDLGVDQGVDQGEEASGTPLGTKADGAKWPDSSALEEVGSESLE